MSFISPPHPTIAQQPFYELYNVNDEDAVLTVEAIRKLEELGYYSAKLVMVMTGYKDEQITRQELRKKGLKTIKRGRNFFFIKEEIDQFFKKEQA